MTHTSTFAPGALVSAVGWTILFPVGGVHVAHRCNHGDLGDGPRLLVLTPRAVVGWCYFNDEEQLRTWVS